ncbi:hypothetical protein ATANTOWER_026357 [Ataeniobius toweri]|uniref:Uncharacterized protein n=1 Tax=Ataeniobius toweri TaxID=208326 RepID=A0ABU7BL54_9TELE|nr:hypothetical protein [Ataeniobius toweri]
MSKTADGFTSRHFSVRLGAQRTCVNEASPPANPSPTLRVNVHRQDDDVPVGPLVLHKLLPVLPCPHRNHHPGGLVHGEHLSVTHFIHGDIPEQQQQGSMASLGNSGWILALLRASPLQIRMENSFRVFC